MDDLVKPVGQDEVRLYICSYNNLPEHLQPDACNPTPHRHSFYEILHLTGGRGTNYIDFQPYPITPGTLYCLAPGQVHFWQVEEPVQGHALLFEESFLISEPIQRCRNSEIAFFQCLEQPVIHLDESQENRVHTMLDNLEAEFNSNLFSRTSALRAMLHLFIVEVQRLQGLQSTLLAGGTDLGLTTQYQYLLRQGVSMATTVEMYADQLQVSPSRLRHAIKKSTGRSPGQLLRKELLLEAKRLLAHSSLSVAEICFRLGFEDPSYFSRFFKRESGHSPRHFRKQWQKS